jgi:mannan endo-1,4-beta-mannosidase
MMAGNGLFYPIFGFASVVLLIYMSFGDVRMGFEEEIELSFVERKGSQFVLDGKAFYINGWNSYWFMVQSVDVYTRPRVSEMLKIGAKMGLTVCRTWAFNDGDYNVLQTSPGVFNEQAFKVF